MITDELTVFRHLSTNPDLTFADIARAENWIMPNGLPYHVRVARIVKRLERMGCIKRNALGYYEPIREPAIEYVPPPREPKPRTVRDGVHVPGRYLRDTSDAWDMIRRIAAVARQLPSPH